MPEIPVIKMPESEFFSWNRNDPVGLRRYIFNTYGDIAKIDMKSMPNYFFMSPDHAQVIFGEKQDNFFDKHPFLVHGFAPIIGTDTFFTLNDREKWKKDRHIALKAIDAMVHFERYAKRMYEMGKMRVDGWTQKYKDNQKVNMAREFGSMTLDFIHNSFFCYIDEVPEKMYDTLYDCVGIIIDKQTSLKPSEWETPKKIKIYEDAVGTLRQIYQIWVKNRLDSGQEFDDFMGLMIHEYSNEFGKEKLIENMALQVSMASTAGFFTSSPAFLWLFIELAQHPDVEKKICEEINRVIGDGQPTYEQIRQLSYCNAAIKESMRLNPTSYNTLRVCTEDTYVKDYLIPKGSGIIVSISQIHRHPNFWKDPDTFNPDRFLDKPMGQDHPYAFIPFGAGKRACIARQLVFLELLIALVLITRRFSFELVPFRPIKPIMTAPITMRPNETDLIIKFKKT